MSLVKRAGLGASLGGLLVFLIIGLVEAAFPAGPADDTIESLGKFRIHVTPQFRPLMVGYPGYSDPKLESPLLYDPATVVGRSDPHTEGSPADIGGTFVGTSGVPVKDGDFYGPFVPPVFLGDPSLRREVHTRIESLDLTMFLGAAVRAGSDAPARPPSPGEVQARDLLGNPANDFPADSFFHVYVETDLPAFGGFPGGTLYNPIPLLVINYDLTDPPGLPPRVVYVHGNSSAVPVHFLDSNPPYWSADDLFGFMVLAGHGASYTNSPADQAEFEEIYDTLEEMPLPEPTPTPVGGIAELPPLAESAARSATPADGSGWSSGAYAALAGGLAAAAVALGGGAWYARRRFSRS